MLLPYFLAIAAVIVADQWLKFWMLDEWDLLSGTIHEITPFFNLVLVWNPGVSFGLFATGSDASRWLLIGITSAVSVGLFVWLLRAQTHWLRSAIVLVIGGAVGNIIDRFIYGAVVDFLDFHVMGYHWPVFNLADSCICVGVAMLLWDSIRNQPQKSA